MAVDIDSAVDSVTSHLDEESAKIDDMLQNMDPSNTQDMMKLQMEYSKYSMEQETLSALVASIKKMIDNITQRM